MASLTAAVRAALVAAPLPLRSLAREAGVAHTTLVRIRSGALNATPATAAAVAAALERHAADCLTPARRIRAALPRRS